MDNADCFCLVFKKLLQSKKINPNISLLDLYKKIVLKAREGTLNQTIEDRIIKALMLKTNQLNQPKI